LDKKSIIVSLLFGFTLILLSPLADYPFDINKSGSIRDWKFNIHFVREIKPVAPIDTATVK